MNKKKILNEYVVQGFLDDYKVDVALKISDGSHHDIEDIILACGFVSSNNIAQVRAKRFKLHYVDLSKFIPDNQALSLIPRNKALEYTILPLMIQDDELMVAIDEYVDFKHQEYLEEVSNRKIKYVVCSKKHILHHLITHPYYAEDDEIKHILEVIKEKSQVNIKELVDLFIEDAIEDNASDIHISPEETIVNIFYRVDGVLVHYHTLPIEFIDRFVSKIKTMCQLDIKEKKLPQDGQFDYKYMETEFKFRVSTINTINGENIVLRILKNEALELDIDHLGLTEENRNLLKNISKQPNGLVLLTGPTGSGKTTTLYSVLKEIDSLRKNVLTVEDPIEYQLPFIKQTQIDIEAGYKFDVAIRAFLRQDPDVILVGEIRDEQTATQAIRASMTGHLVLSTLHTNDSVGALARILDLGIKEYLVGSATLAIIAQRLVRKLCKYCKVKVNNPEQEIKKWRVNEELLEGVKDVTIYEAKGCSKCSNTGYHSREVIVEILQIDKYLEDMITSSQNSLDILNYAKSKGMLTMLDDAHLKVLTGTTTFQEIDRVLLDSRFYG